MAVQFSRIQQQLQFEMVSALTGGAANQTAPLLNQKLLVPPPPVLSEPVSELTCNISGSRKRAREDEPLLQAATASLTMHKYERLMLQKHYQRKLLLQYQNQQQVCRTQPENSRANQSILTSTSGRPATMQYPSSVPSFPASTNNNNDTTITTGLGTPSFPSTNLIALLNQQSLEVDDLIRLHADKLRSSLDDARKRQCRALLSAVAQHAQGRIAEKQAEIEAAENKNAELQERLRQAAAESQAWFNVARNSEVVIASLRDSLEQALVQNLNGGGDGDGGNKCVDSQVEGYGDSEEVAITEAPGTAASSAAGVPCPGGRFTEASKRAVADVCKADEIRFSPCKSCGACDGCVLVLPCRHLCLCQSCEPDAVECPVCRGRKNGSLAINMW